MDATRSEKTDAPSQRRDSAFLSLLPVASTAPLSPASTNAVASPVEGVPSSISQIIEPLKKAQRSSSDSSTASASGTFLRLAPVEQDE